MAKEARFRLVVLWSCQVVAAIILGTAGVLKISGGGMAVFIFEQLQMEPFGRYLIGFIEIAAALMLLSSSFAAVGAVLCVGTMVGAAIAHATYLGVSVQGDDGKLMLMLIVVLASSLTVLILRRRTLPLVGPTL